MKTTSYWVVSAAAAVYFNIDIGGGTVIFLVLLFSGLGFITYIAGVDRRTIASEQIGGPAVNSTAISMIR